MSAAVLFLVGLAASVGAYAVSCVCLERLRRRGRGERIPELAPGVSIVKPLRGLDEELEGNLESFFALEYPAFEVVFSFASREDPAFPVARRVADRHPEIATTFVFDPREPGGNAKVNRLLAGLRHARHRLLLFSDGNVRVRSDFLARAVSHFADPGMGLASNLFRAEGAVSPASRLEALYLNGCLQGGTAAVSAVLGMPCVVGKSILVSRAALDAIGGIGALRDHLAEDYLLGRQVRRAGYRVVLSGDVLQTSEVRKSLRAVWERHRRWAMMRRRLAGWLYGGEILTSPLPWAAAAALASAGALAPSLAAVALLAARYGLEAALVARLGAPLAARDIALMPLRDLLVTALFFAGLAGRRVAWRGRPMRIGRETLILGVEAAQGRAA